MDTTFNQSGNPWQLGTTGGRVARWVFGFGFFSVSLGVYLVTGMTLLIVNLLDDPSDLWVGGPLLRWGALVFVHFLGAVVCWAITTAMDAARETRAETEARVAVAPNAPPPIPSTVLHVSPETGVPDVPAMPRPRFQPTPSTPADGVTEDEGRRFGFRSWRGETPYSDVRPRTSPPGWTVMGPGVPASTPRPDETPSAAQKTGIMKEGAAVLGDPAITVAPVEGDQRWTWVEAAAEAWLANRAGVEAPVEKSSTDANEEQPEPDTASKDQS